MSSLFVQQMLAGHSALGLALGGLIYLVCVTGTLAVFVAELRDWEQPRATVNVTEPFLDTALAEAQRRVTPGGYLYLTLPPMERGRARLQIGGGAQPMHYAVGTDGRIGGTLETPFTDLIETTHLYLSLPQNAGLIVVGLIGAALLSLLLSGVLAHPRIFRDAFMLRWGGAKRLQEADLHNRLSVWGLPFHLVVVLTGVFFGLSPLLTWVVATAAYHGDTNRITHLLGGPSVAADTTPGAFPPVAPLLARLGVLHELDRVNYIGIENVGTQRELLSIEMAVPGRLARGERQFFDGNGRYLGSAGDTSGTGGKQLYAAAASLHFGSFGGFPVRLAYGALGFALCVVSAGGVSIWAARRRDQGRPALYAERLWAGTVWGVLAALAVSAAAGLTSHVPLVGVFWSMLLLVLAITTMQRPAAEASHPARIVLAASVGAAAIFHLLKFRHVLDGVGTGIDGFCLLTAAVALRPWWPRAARSSTPGQ